MNGYGHSECYSCERTAGRNVQLLMYGEFSDVTCSSLFAHICWIAKRTVQVDVVLLTVVLTAES